jgi:hypothetical protein
MKNDSGQAEMTEVMLCASGISQPLKSNVTAHYLLISESILAGRRFNPGFFDEMPIMLLVCLHSGVWSLQL